MKYKIAVLGGGDIGKAKAAYLASKGHSVRLYNRSLSRIEPFISSRILEYTGVLNGIGHINTITTNIIEAIEGAEIILFTTPSIYHADMATKIAPYLNNKHIIILFSGKFAGSALIDETIKQVNPGFSGTVIEATSIFSSRLNEKNQICIRGIKQKVRFASVNSTKTIALTPVVRNLFSSLVPASSLLERSFCDIGCILHIPIFLSIMTRIEQKEDFYFYKQAVTPKLADLITSIDNERIAVAKAYNLEVPSLKDIIKEYYLSEGDSLYEVIHNTDTYMMSKAPKTLDHRYITEEMTQSLVPMYKMALHKGLSPVLMRSYIDIASVIYQRPFIQQGRDISFIYNKECTCV